MITGMHHAAMRTYDFDKAVRFYEEGLGLKPCFKSGEGDKRMILFPVGTSYIEIFADGTEKPHGAIEHFALSSDDVDSDFAKAIAAGAKEERSPVDIKVPGTFGGELDLRVAFVISPTGEMIEFFMQR